MAGELSSRSKVSFRGISLLFLVAVVAVAEAARLLPLEDEKFQVIYFGHNPSAYTNAVLRARLLRDNDADVTTAVQVAVKLINLPQPVLQYWSAQALLKNQELQSEEGSQSRRFSIPPDLFPDEQVASDSLLARISEIISVQRDSIEETLDFSRRGLVNELDALLQICPEPDCFPANQIVRPLGVLLLRDCTIAGTLPSYHLRTDLADYVDGIPEPIALDWTNPSKRLKEEQWREESCEETPHPYDRLLDLRGIVFEYCEGGTLADRMEGVLAMARILLVGHFTQRTWRME